MKALGANMRREAKKGEAKKGEAKVYKSNAGSILRAGEDEKLLYEGHAF